MMAFGTQIQHGPYDHPSQVSARSSRHTASTSSPSAQQLAKHSVLSEGGRLPDVDCTLILCGQSLHLAAIIPPAAESPALTGDAPLLRGTAAVSARGALLQDDSGCCRMRLDAVPPSTCLAASVSLLPRPGCSRSRSSALLFGKPARLSAAHFSLDFTR